MDSVKLLLVADEKKGCEHKSTINNTKPLSSLPKNHCLRHLLALASTFAGPETGSPVTYPELRAKYNELLRLNETLSSTQRQVRLVQNQKGTRNLVWEAIATAKNVQLSITFEMKGKLEMYWQLKLVNGLTELLDPSGLKPLLDAKRLASNYEACIGQFFAILCGPDRDMPVLKRLELPSSPPLVQELPQPKDMDPKELFDQLVSCFMGSSADKTPAVTYPQLHANYLHLVDINEELSCDEALVRLIRAQPNQDGKVSWKMLANIQQFQLCITFEMWERLEMYWQMQLVMIGSTASWSTSGFSPLRHSSSFTSNYKNCIHLFLTKIKHVKIPDDIPKKPGQIICLTPSQQLFKDLESILIGKTGKRFPVPLLLFRGLYLKLKQMILWTFTENDCHVVLGPWDIFAFCNLLKLSLFFTAKSSIQVGWQMKLFEKSSPSSSRFFLIDSTEVNPLLDEVNFLDNFMKCLETFYSHQPEKDQYDQSNKKIKVEVTHESDRELTEFLEPKEEPEDSCERVCSSTEVKVEIDA